MLASCMLLASCGQGFTPQETELINGGKGAMRLFTADNAADSLLLRQNAAALSDAHFRSDEFGLLKERMLATVNDPENRGVGIAAPQVGISRRLVAVQRYDIEGNPFRFYINPEIIGYSDAKVMSDEGCLSVPRHSGVVARSSSVTVRYVEEGTFTERTEDVGGFTAIIFQHEIDHLDGVLFTDREGDI